jgi:hypothetical protein
MFMDPDHCEAHANTGRRAEVVCSGMQVRVSVVIPDAVGF